MLLLQLTIPINFIKFNFLDNNYTKYKVVGGKIEQQSTYKLPEQKF